MLSSLFSLVPAVLALGVQVVGIVLVLQRGRGALWSKLAVIGLGLMALAALLNAGMVSAFVLGGARAVDIAGLFSVVGGMGSLASLVGLGLVVTALVTDRSPGPSPAHGTPEPPAPYGQGYGSGYGQQPPGPAA